MIELLPLEYQYCKEVAELAAKYLPEAWSYKAVCDVLKYDNNIYYVMKDCTSGTIIGFAGMMVIADEAELLNIVVSSLYRRKGIASRLLKQLLDDARGRQAYRMLLEVRESNDGARRLYEQNQFFVIGKRKAYYNNPTEDALIMESML